MSSSRKENLSGVSRYLRSGRTTADAKKNPASAFMLAYHVDGDAVAITASVVFGAFDNNSGSDPMTADHPKQYIGTYSLHPNESVVLQEMEQFGLQPWTVKIVNAQLPTSAGPPNINEVPSIQSKILGQDRQARPTSKTGDAIGRARWESSFLGHPGAEFFRGKQNQHKKRKRIISKDLTGQ
jgi:hypothetical protein